MNDFQEIIDYIKTDHFINLSLNKIGIQYSEVEEIAEALKMNQSITTLDLSANRIGSAGAKKIAEALKINQRITNLNLACNQIEDVGAKDIAEALKINQSVTTINFYDNLIGNDGARGITEALKVNKTITTIDLAGNQIGDMGAKDIAEALKINQYITILDLAGNQIGFAGAKDIAEALKLKQTILTVSLVRNHIGDEGTKYIAEALKKNQSITNLYLNHNQIGEDGAKNIAEALKFNHSITDLDLSGNPIGDIGVKILAEALKINQSITTLQLRNNQIEADGMKYIAEALQINQFITKLHLNGNKIGCAGAKNIAEALKNNKSLISLHFYDTHIGNTGAKDLAEALNINQSITDLDLSGNKIGDAGAEDIINALKINRSITSLHLTRNEIGENRANDIIKALKRNRNIAHIVKLFEITDQEQKFDANHQLIKKLSNLIRDGSDRLQEHTKKGVLLLGNTGAGKSTLTHLICGRRLQAIMDDETNELVIDAMEPIEDIVIGHEPVSETRIPNKCPIKNAIVWDCPGFNDTDPVQEIANSFYIKRLFDITSQLKFVLLVPEVVLNSANERGNIFLETLSQFLKYFKDIEDIMCSTSLVVTQVPLNKKIHHVQNSIDKILTCNQGATDKHRALIKIIKDNGSLHLFYKPSREGELTIRELIGTSDFFETIDASSEYSDVKGEMVNIAISKRAMNCSFHFFNTSASTFNQLVQVVVNAVGYATHCTNANPLNTFSENYTLFKHWLPSSIQYKNLLIRHDKDEYFLELDLLLKLQKVFNCDQVVDLLDTVIIFQKSLELFAEYSEPGDVHLQHQIQSYSYCLQQQYEYVKFFSSVCETELPEYTKLGELIKICHSKVTRNLEKKVVSLRINENQSDPHYYNKAIKYLENYQDSSVCMKKKALAYSCLSDIAKKNGDTQSALVYCVKSLHVNSQSPNVYEKLGQLYFNEGDYARAIVCYKVVNNEFKIKTCFKAWLKQHQENPDIMLTQAEYFESIGLFEQAKKYYHHAFSLSQDDNMKAAALQKIGNIMVNTVAHGQDFITRAQEHNFFNFPLVIEEFISNVLDIQI